MQPNNEGDPLEGILHFPEQPDAIAQAAHLSTDTALVWRTQYDADTGRFHVVLDAHSVKRVTPAGGHSHKPVRTGRRRRRSRRATCLAHLTRGLGRSSDVCSSSGRVVERSVPDGPNPASADPPPSSG